MLTEQLLTAVKPSAPVIVNMMISSQSGLSLLLRTVKESKVCACLESSAYAQSFLAASFSLRSLRCRWRRSAFSYQTKGVR